MSSTNVHSNLYACGGETIAKSPEQGIEMPPKNAGKGPSRLNVIEGERATIPASNNIVVKDDKKVVARADYDVTKSLEDLEISDITDVLVGNIAKIEQAMNEKTGKSTIKGHKKSVDMEK